MLHSLIPLLGGRRSGLNFWMLYGTAAVNNGHGIAVDSSDNIIVCGSGAAVIGTSDGWVAKFNASGDEIWAKAIGAGATNSHAFSVAVDSNDDILVGVRSTEPGYGANDVVIVKLSGANGSITWQREVGTAGTDTPYSIAVDASDNVYSLVSKNAAGVLLMKWNSGGTLQWQRQLASAGTDTGFGLAVDSSGNAYICGGNGTTTNGFVAKYNSSGTIQWQKQVQNTTSCGGIAVDGSGNVYLHSYYDAATDVFEITKLSSTPTLTWTRKVTSSPGNSITRGIVVDGSGNVFVAGLEYDSVDVFSCGFVGQWNSSGTNQWKARIGDVNGNDTTEFYGMAMDSTGALLVVARSDADGAGGSDALIGRIPNDGTGTGTYGTHEYEASTATEAAGSASLAAGAMTDSAGAITEAAGNLSVAALSFTLELFEI